MNDPALRARRRLLIERAFVFVMGLTLAAVGVAGLFFSDDLVSWFTNWLSS